MEIVDLIEAEKMVKQPVEKGVRVPLELEDKPRRKVMLEVNTSEPTQFYVETQGADRVFLANINGRGRIIFIVDGPAAVWADTDGDVYWYTPELENVSVITDGQTFTRVLERASRNPAMEAISAKMQLNALRREKKQQDEIATLRELMAEQSAAIERLKPKEPKAPEETKETKAPEEKK